MAPHTHRAPSELVLSPRTVDRQEPARRWPVRRSVPLQPRADRAGRRDCFGRPFGPALRAAVRRSIEDRLVAQGARVRMNPGRVVAESIRSQRLVRRRLTEISAGNRSNGAGPVLFGNRFAGTFCRAVRDSGHCRRAQNESRSNKARHTERICVQSTESCGSCRRGAHARSSTGRKTAQ